MSRRPEGDPRKQFEVFAFQAGVEKMEDLKPGMKLPGIVTNVTAFGAFVDIGVHQDGLVYVSQLSGHFHKCAHVRCAAFGLGLGVRRAHHPQWGCNRRATTPQAKSSATLRAAVLFGAGFVVRSSQTHEGYARRSRLACAKNALPRT